jgi:ABC-type sugar transport system ATPase subunit
MYIRDLERLVRTLHRQRCDHLYIRHYLQETYQVTDAIIDQVFEVCGVSDGKKDSIVKKTQDMMGGKKTPAKGKGDDSKIRRSGFY